MTTLDVVKSKIKCARCYKIITDGRDEEGCIECNATLCLECYENYFVCKECEKEKRDKQR